MNRLMLKTVMLRMGRELKLTRAQRRAMAKVLESKEAMISLLARVQKLANDDPKATAVKDWALWMWEHREEILAFIMLVARLFQEFQ